LKKYFIRSLSADFADYTDYKNGKTKAQSLTSSLLSDFFFNL
jgi:hypothetical protein